GVEVCEAKAFVSRKEITRIDRDRPAGRFDRLVILLQLSKGPRLGPIQIIQSWVAWTKPNRLVKEFEAIQSVRAPWMLRPCPHRRLTRPGPRTARVPPPTSLGPGAPAPGVHRLSPREHPRNLDRGRAPATPIRRPVGGRARGGRPPPDT